MVHSGGACGGAVGTIPVQLDEVVVNPSSGTSVTSYVPAGSSTSFRPSASKAIVRPPTVNLKSVGGLVEPTTTLRTWRRRTGTGSAVFVIVQTGTCGCGEAMTPVHPS